MSSWVQRSSLALIAAVVVLVASCRTVASPGTAAPSAAAAPSGSPASPPPPVEPKADTARPEAASTSPAVEDAPSPELVAQGSALYAKHICSVCHSNDGTPRAAPSFKGLYGREEKLRDGTTVKVDPAYIRESILNPAAKVTDGFQPVMPAYVGRISDAEILALTAYIQSLR